MLVHFFLWTFMFHFLFVKRWAQWPRFWLLASLHETLNNSSSMLCVVLLTLSITFQSAQNTASGAKVKTVDQPAPPALLIIERVGWIFQPILMINPPPILHVTSHHRSLLWIRTKNSVQTHTLFRLSVPPHLALTNLTKNWRETHIVKFASVPLLNKILMHIFRLAEETRLVKEGWGEKGTGSRSLSP